MKTNLKVLVTAAAGGTGVFAVQLAKLAGNHVIGTCSSDEKIQMLKQLGCDRVINYKKENMAQVLKTEYPDGYVVKKIFCLSMYCVRLSFCFFEADYTGLPSALF